MAVLMVMGVLAFLFTYMALVYLAMGFTLSTLWNDFIPQIFPQLPMLSFWQALAVSLVLGLFISPGVSNPFRKEKEESLWRMAGEVMIPFFRCGIALLAGLVIKAHI